MAKMTTITNVSLDELNITEDLANAMLDAKGAIIVQKEREAAASTFKQHTGNLANSFTLNKTLKKDKSGRYYKSVSPVGVHHIGKNGKSISNAEVAFVQNYGAPQRNIKATHFIDKANDAAEAEATAAAEEVFNEYIKE